MTDIKEYIVADNPVSYSELESLFNRIYHHGLLSKSSKPGKIYRINGEEGVERAFIQIAKIYLENKKISIK